MTDRAPIRCVSGGLSSAVGILAALLLGGAAQAQEVSLVPVTVDGQPVRLAMRIYRPAGPGPAPTLVFNHGSTGSGRDPSIFSRPIDAPRLAQFFVQRGWAVVMPARRGRGGSEGVYDEGFAPRIGRRAIPARSSPPSKGRTAPGETSRRPWTRSSRCRSSIGSAWSSGASRAAAS